MNVFIFQIQNFLEKSLIMAPFLSDCFPIMLWGSDILVHCTGPLSQFGNMGLQGKILGLWDYTLFEIGITEMSFEIGIMDLKLNQIWIFHPQ